MALLEARVRNGRLGDIWSTAEAGAHTFCFSFLILRQNFIYSLSKFCVERTEAQNRFKSPCPPCKLKKPKTCGGMSSAQ
jgi:hypothetical protein